MPPSVLSSRLFVERGLARHLSAQRSSKSLLGRDSPSPVQSSDSPTASSGSTDNGPAGISLPPHGTSALVGIVVMLCVFVLGFAAWRIWAYRRDKRSAASEKPRHEGLFDPVDEDTAMKRTFSTSSSGAVLVALPTDPKAAMTRDQISKTFKIGLTYQPKVVYDSQSTVPPGITITPAGPSLQITPPPIYDGSIPSPMVSPRTAASIKPKGASGVSSKLPRLVVVETTFTTTLHDELAVRVGETLRLLEEYEDEWCLVQRVGPKDTEKGVVPRFCVVDKPEVVHSRKSRHIPRLSSSSTRL